MVFRSLFLKVYEEKQKRFELELEELRQGCATRMQVASQKAQRAQQVLQLQVRTSAREGYLDPLGNRDAKTKKNLYDCGSSAFLFNLRLQIYQLQQDKKKLQEEFAQLLKEREELEERCTSYEHEKIQLGPRLEESKWEVNICNGLMTAAKGWVNHA